MTKKRGVGVRWIGCMMVFVAGCSNATPPGGGRPWRESAPISRVASPAPDPSVASTPTDATGSTSGLRSLAELIATAEAGHPDVAAARARMEQASGRAEQAGLLPNPQAIGRLESASFEGRTGEDAEIVAGVSQQLPIGGRLGAARAVEERDGERLALESAAARLSVRTRVRRAYAEAVHHRQVAEIRGEAVTNAEGGVKIAEARRSTGDVTTAEVARAEMERSRAIIERDAASARYAQSLEALATAVGVPGDRVEDVDPQDPDLDPSASLTTTVEANGDVASHPAVASAAAQIGVERAREELARAERIPDVSLDLLYRRSADDRDGFDVGAVVTLPLFDRNQGKIREARAAKVAAEASARSARIQTEGRLRELRIQLDRALTAARTAREDLLPRAEAVLKMAETRYAAHDVGLAEVLLARRDWIEIRLQVVDAVREVRDAWAELQAYESERKL